MRTKTLLLTAALSVAGVATSMAQTVYSVNAVGYVNLGLPTGFSIIANPLVAADNSVKALFAGSEAKMLDGTTIYKFTGTKYDLNTFEFGVWANPAMTLVPGEGAFIFVPTAGTFTNTFVGEVSAGSLTNSVPAGFSIKSSQVPQAGLLQTDLKYPADEGDTVYQFSNAAKKYVPASYEFGAWTAEPNVKVGEGFFIKPGAARSWKRTFSIGG